MHNFESPWYGAKILCLKTNTIFEKFVLPELNKENIEKKVR